MIFLEVTGFCGQCSSNDLLDLALMEIDTGAELCHGVEGKWEEEDSEVQRMGWILSVCFFQGWL